MYLTLKIVSGLDIDANTTDSLYCKESKYSYPVAGHAVTGNLKLICKKAMIRNRCVHIITVVTLSGALYHVSWIN